MCPPLSPISVSITNHLGFGIYNSAVKIHFLCKSWYTFPFPNLKKKKNLFQEEGKKECETREEEKQLD